MAFVQLGCTIFFSALIPLVFGICDNYPTEQEYFKSRAVQSASKKELTTFVQYEKFTIPLEVGKCRAEVTANPNYKHAFSKYTSWTEEEGVDDSVMHYGCTCKEVNALFDFAKDTKPNHIMCRQTEIYATFCDGFQKDATFKDKPEALLAALKDIDSDILEYIFHDGAQLVRQYLTNKEVGDAQWPLAQTLAYIKTQKDAFAGQVGGIVAAAVERKEIEANDKAVTESRIVQVHTSTVANIVSHTMDLGLQLQTAKDIIGEVNFNSLTYKGKLLGLEAVVKDPKARAYVMSEAGKLPKFLELISVIILPLSIVPLDGPNEVQIEVKKFVANFFEDVSVKQQDWDMESSLQSLSTYCKITLKDIKTILAEQKKAAEEAAKKKKEAEAILAAEREEEAKAEAARKKAAEEKQAKAGEGNQSGGEQASAEKKEEKNPPASEQTGGGKNNGQQQPEGQAANTQAQQEQKDQAVQQLGGGRIATTQPVEEDRTTAEQKKIAAFLKSFKALNDKAALALYIKENAANSEETLKVDRNEHFLKEVTLTCSYK